MTDEEFVFLKMINTDMMVFGVRIKKMAREEKYSKIKMTLLVIIMKENLKMELCMASENIRGQVAQNMKATGCKIKEKVWVLKNILMDANILANGTEALERERVYLDDRMVK